MAPPTGKRSNQKSLNPPPSSLPLPGVALGLLAAFATGFAASRAFRRRKPPRSLEDDEQFISAGDSTPILDVQLVQESKIENEEKDGSVNTSAVVVNAKGIVTIAQEIPKLAAGLKPVFEAFEEVSAQARDVEIKPLQENKGKKDEEKDCGNRKREEEGEAAEYEEIDKKTGETIEDGNTMLEEGELADIILGLEASLIVDEASVAAFRGKFGKGAAQKYEKEAVRRSTERELETDACQGIGRDIDDDGTSSESQSSPVLINGRALDFFEELPDSKEDPDHSSGRYSFSDAVSESSLQEATSAPVNPFLPTEEYMEASWPVANPDAVVPVSQHGDKKAFVGDELGCNHERKEGVSELEEIFSLTDEAAVKFKLDQLNPNEDADTCVVGLKGKEPCVEEVKFEMVADVQDVKIKENSLALEGKISLLGNGCDEGTAGMTRINGKAVINGSLLPEKVNKSEGLGEDKPVSLPKGEIDVSTGENEESTQSVRINGKLFLDESPVDDGSANRVVIVDRTSSQVEQEMGDDTIFDAYMEPDLLPASESSDAKKCVGSERELNDDDEQEMGDGTIFDAYMEPDLLPASESSGEKKCVSSERELNEEEDDDDEPLQQNGCFGTDSSGKEGVFEGNVTESIPHCVQNLDAIDSTGAENEIGPLEEQSSSVEASKEGSKGGKTSCAEETIDSLIISSGREAGIIDGPVEEIEVEEITCEKEEETRETTRSYDAKDLILQSKKLASLTGAAHVSDIDTEKDADKGAFHYQDLEQKGRFLTKVLRYLPLQVGFACVLIALISFMLWHLEASTLPQS